VTTPRVRLVVLFGGRSAEHEVSCVSAVSVLRALDPKRYDVVPVGITHEGQWVLAEGAQRVLESAAASPALPVALEALGPEVEPMEAIEARAGDDAPVVVLPLLHGPFGEDGTVQGLCELAGVAYAGAGVLGSAVAMDKIVAKRLLAEAGMPQVRWLGLRESVIDDATAGAVAGTLGWPVFVKPANLGSSVGVSKADDAVSFDAALRGALAYDEWVVVEEAVQARELECGVLGNVELEASVVGEIRPSRQFYDYEDKYLEGAAELVAPADIPAEVSAEVQRMARAAFAALRAEGMARVDFFYEEGKRGLLVNELNTIPGFTPISMFPRLWDISGVPYPRLIDRLVELALERHARRSGKVGRGRL
jgi:D-alanine-D-alanine ligase